MKVHELIAKLQDLPQNSDIHIADGDCIGMVRDPKLSQEWSDEQENYVIVL